MSFKDYIDKNNSDINENIKKSINFKFADESINGLEKMLKKDGILALNFIKNTNTDYSKEFEIMQKHIKEISKVWKKIVEDTK